MFGLVFALVSSSPAEWGASGDYMQQGSCQGSACHEAWREQLLSCTGNRATTFKLRYITLGVLGFIFGYLGLQGCSSRNGSMVKAFAWYLIFVAMFLAFVCAADNFYALACNSLSLNTQRDIGFWIPWKTMGIIHAQGHTDLSAFHPDKLKHILGYDFMLNIALVYVALFFIILYFAYYSFDLAGAIEAGPVGLGGNFKISTDATREIDQMKERLLHVAVEQLRPVNYDEAFGRLQDANAFPYTSFKGTTPAMQYGNYGAAIPFPANKDPHKSHK